MTMYDEGGGGSGPPKFSMTSYVNSPLRVVSGE